MDAINRVDGRVLRCRVIVVDSDDDNHICFSEFLFAAVHCVVHPYITTRVLGR